jgi:thiosulfate dehydrogenase [quinone] large subunit
MRGNIMFAIRHALDSKGTLLIQDPPIAQFLFQSTEASVIWLVLRLWMAYEWIEAGWHKFTDPAWMVDGTGILGFWTRALGNAPNGKPVITYDWYRVFIQFLVDSNASVWFAKVITFGELAIGLGLLIGAFVGIAAFFGALMNMSFLMAGTVSTNPVLFFAGILLILAWKNAGYLGLDRFLLPALGTPWRQPKQDTRPAAPTIAPHPA